MINKIKYKTRSPEKHRINKSQSNLFNNHVSHMLKWLSKTYGINPVLFRLSKDFRNFINHVDRSKGREYALKINKYFRLSVTRYLSGEPLVQSDVCRLTYDGLPIRLKGLIAVIRSKDASCLRYVLTLLSALRRITLPLNPDIGSIISPYKGQQDLDLKSYVKGFTRALSKKGYRKGLFLNNKIKFKSWEGFHLSTKSGPTSKQALYSHLDDLENIPECLRESIYCLGGSDLQEKMETALRNLDLLREELKLEKGVKTDFRKLVPIQDSEGKTRVIAIGDYYSQTCLKPLHDTLYSILKLIPQDRTFNQGKDLEKLPLDGSRSYHCFDLSSATDRFPVVINNLILEFSLGKEKTDAWHDIMVGYPFSYNSPDGKLSKYYYSVGQPMGFYSSWASFALSHHFIVYYCCRKRNIAWTSSNYLILGDDIVIYDDALATAYTETMSSLGVEISDSKTHRSNIFFEFAKRYFVPGGEISPFSIRALFEETKSFAAFTQLIYANMDKGWTPCLPVKAALFNFYSTGQSAWRRKSHAGLMRIIERSLDLYRWLRGFDNDLILVNKVLMTLSLPSLSCNQFKIAQAMMNQVIVRSFEKSASSFSGDSEDRVFNLVLRCSSDPTSDMVLVPYSSPYCYVMGKFVEQAYLVTMQRAYDFDLLEGGKWLPYFRIVKATDASSLFRGRNHAVVSKSVPILTELTISVSKELNEWPGYKYS